MPLPTLRAAALRPLAQHVAARGVRVDALLRGCAVDPAWLEDAEARVPVALSDRTWERAADASDDPFLALHVAQGVRAHSFGLLTYLLAHSATLGEALERLCDHYRVLSGGTAYHLERRSDHVRLHARLQRPQGLGRQVADFSLAVVHGFASHYVPAWQLRSVQMHPPEPDAGPFEHARVFGAPVQFDHEVHALVFDAELLHAPVRDADPHLLPILQQQASHEPRPPASDALVRRTRIQVAGALAAARPPSLEGAARALGVSPRSLRRRLAEQGVPFSRVVDDARREIAETLLEGGATQVEDVALRAGFSGARALNRAFVRWHGMSAAAFRRARA